MYVVRLQWNYKFVTLEYFFIIIANVNIL